MRIVSVGMLGLDLAVRLVDDHLSQRLRFRELAGSLDDLGFGARDRGGT
jgi:hypothetical protein